MGLLRAEARHQLYQLRTGMDSNVSSSMQHWRSHGQQKGYVRPTFGCDVGWTVHTSSDGNSVCNMDCVNATHQSRDSFGRCLCDNSTDGTTVATNETCGTTQ